MDEKRREEIALFRYQVIAPLLYVEPGRGALKKAIECAPERPYYAYRLGALYLAVRDYRAAEHYFRIAVEIEPMDAFYRFRLGDAFFGQGKWELAAQEYENVLNWFYDRQFKVPLELKATCAPHYNRILRQRAREEGRKVDFATFGTSAVSRGCLGGQGFVFVSHTGQVQPCGYLDLNCGQVREKDFAEIYRTSPTFLKLRDKGAYQGKCPICEYFQVCGGCRARAYEATGDFLAEEPLCLYQPQAV